MSDYDTTQGIFMKALKCNEDFSRGLELEYSGDHYMAMLCYEKALSDSTTFTNDVEKQKLEESYFNSLAKLGLWDDLNT